MQMATTCAQHPGACEFRPQGKGNLQGRPQAAKATGTLLIQGMRSVGLVPDILTVKRGQGAEVGMLGKNPSGACFGETFVLCVGCGECGICGDCVSVMCAIYAPDMCVCCV